MQTCENHLFVLSFTVGGDSGLALISAESELEAVQLLRSNGRRREIPESYVVVESKDLGICVNLRCGLIMESYVNALAAWDLIEERFNLICNCDDDEEEEGGEDEQPDPQPQPQPDPEPTPEPTPAPDMSNYVTRDELAQYITETELREAIAEIDSEGGGQMNVIERITRNNTSLPVQNKTVNVQVPTTVAELSDSNNYATKTYVDERVIPSSASPSTFTPGIPVVQASGLNVTMDANTYYVWGNVNRLTLSLNRSSEVDGYLNEYSGEFTVASGFTGINLPSGVTVADLYFYELPQTEYFRIGATYQFSIIRNVMSIYSSYIP